MKEKIAITTPYITLGQFLKFINVASGGGDIKAILFEGLAKVNGETETRRGRKLYPDDNVDVEGVGEFVVTKTTD